MSSRAGDRKNVFEYRRITEKEDRDILDKYLKEFVAQNQDNLFKNLWNFEKYLDETFAYFNECLINHFRVKKSNQYLHFRIYYRDEQQNSKTLNMFDKFKANPLSKGLDQIDGNFLGSNNFTYYNILQRFHLLGVEISNQNIKKRAPLNEDFPIFGLNIHEDSLKKNIKNKSKSASSNEIDNIITLIHSYKNCVNNENGAVYLYLCKSRNMDKNFNSSFVLALTRRIELWEYRQIIDYFSYIMQAMMIYHFVPKARREEAENLLYSQSHANNQEFNALKDKLDMVLYYLNKHDSYNYLKYGVPVMSYFEQIKSRNDTILTLSYYSNIEHDKVKRDEKYHTRIGGKFESNLNINSILIDCLNLIKDSIHFLDIEKSKTTIFLNVTIPRLIKFLKDEKQYFLSSGIKSVIIILFLERLKNSFYFNQTNEQDIKIGFGIEDNFLKINFENSGFLTKSQYDFMLNPNNYKNDKLTRTKIGEQLADKMINFKPFWTNDTDVKKEIDPKSMDVKLNKTIIYYYYNLKNITYVEKVKNMDS